MPTIVIKTNIAQGVDVLVSDLGLIVPNSGGNVTLVNIKDLEYVRFSNDLRELSTDDAHGANDSTLILNDGFDDIDQDNVDSFLTNILGNTIKSNFTAIVDPTVDDDESKNYNVGSQWVNVATNTVFECVDATTGEAVWTTINDLIQSSLEEPGVVTPGGSLFVYGTSGGITANEIQYARVFLRVGREYGSMRAYVTSTFGAGHVIRMGVYDQTDPPSGSGVPVNKIRETALTEPSTGSFTTLPFTSESGGNWTVPESGYYWLAFVRDATGGGLFETIQTGATYPADFLPVRRETTTSGAFPTTASGLTNPASSVVLVSMLQV